MADVLPSIEDVAATMKGGTASDPHVPPSGTGEKKEAAADAATPVTKEGAKGTPEVSADPAKTVEEKTPEVKKDPPKDTSASRFAALSRKEKELRNAQADVDRRAKEHEAAVNALKEREAKLASADIKKDPLGFMKAHGLSTQDLISSMYGNYKAPEVDPVDAKIQPHVAKMDGVSAELEALKAQLASFQAAQAESQQRQQYEEVMTGLKGAVEADKAKYELVHAFGDEGLDLARDVMVEYYRQHQRLLDYSEACDLVEKHYEEKVIDRLAGTNKIKARMTQGATSVSAASAVTTTKQPTKEATEPTTLTNRLSTGAQANIDIDKLSPEEAIAVLSKKLLYREGS